MVGKTPATGASEASMMVVIDMRQQTLLESAVAPHPPLQIQVTSGTS